MGLLRQPAATLVVAALALLGCAEPNPRPRLRVAVAVSLLPALEEIAQRYSAGDPVAVETHAAASGILVQQIRRGAPVDVFISASIAEHETLRAEGLLAEGSAHDIATNGLVLLVAAGSAPNEPSELADDRYARIALGNPETAPLGRYSAQSLAHYRLTPSLRDRVILAESARQVVDYVRRGEVDAAIVYRTDALTIGAESSRSLALALDSHSPILYRAAVTADAADPARAAGFVDYLRGPEANEILARHGFTAPD